MKSLDQEDSFSACISYKYIYIYNTSYNVKYYLSRFDETLMLK